MIAELPAPAIHAEAIIQERAFSEAWRKIGIVDCALAELPQVKLPLRHLFTPNLYIREVCLPKGTLLTTRIHLAEHPFVLSAGVISVWDAENGVQKLSAPYTGITKPGTRRIIFVHESAIFSTFHVTNETDVNKLVDLLTFDPEELGHMAHLAPEKLAAVRACAKPEKQLT